MRIDSVDGMIKAAAAPITARQAMSCHMAVDKVAKPAATRKSKRPSLQRAFAPVAVTQRARGEQQAGKDERVDSDDPLQLRRAGEQFPREGGHGDVETGVADEDDQQAETQHAKGPPAPIKEGLFVELRGCKRQRDFPSLIYMDGEMELVLRSTIRKGGSGCQPM